MCWFSISYNNLSIKNKYNCQKINMKTLGVCQILAARSSLSCDFIAVVPKIRYFGVFLKKVHFWLFWHFGQKWLFCGFWLFLSIFHYMIKNGNFGYFVIFGVFVKNGVFWYFCEKCKNGDFRRSYKNRYFFKNGVFYKSMKFGVF